MLGTINRSPSARLSAARSATLLVADGLAILADGLGGSGVDDPTGVLPG